MYMHIYVYWLVTMRETAEILTIHTINKYNRHVNTHTHISYSPRIRLSAGSHRNTCTHTCTQRNTHPLTLSHPTHLSIECRIAQVAPSVDSRIC